MKPKDLVVGEYYFVEYYQRVPHRILRYLKRPSNTSDCYKFICAVDGAVNWFTSVKDMQPANLTELEKALLEVSDGTK